MKILAQLWLQVPKYLKSDIALNDVNIMSQSPDSDPAIANVMFIKSKPNISKLFQMSQDGHHARSMIWSDRTTLLASYLGH